MNIKNVVDFLKTHDDFLILTHASPDGDTIGSGYALCGALLKIGKNAKVDCCDEIHERYDYITKSFDIPQFELKTIIAVDVANKTLLGKKLMKYGDSVDLCIDHHPSNVFYAKETYLDASAAAVCEMIYEIVKDLGAEIEKDIANALYTGIATDTGCFIFSNTSAKTHRIAAEMIDCGAEYSEINRIMFDVKSKSRVAIEQKALSNIEYYFEGKCAVIYITREMLGEAGSKDDDLDGITALPRKIEGVLAGVTLREREDGRIKISLRTHAPVNASKICAEFGGGGHMRAAGCEMDSSMEQAKETILKAVSKEL